METLEQCLERLRKEVIPERDARVAERNKYGCYPHEREVQRAEDDTICKFNANVIGFVEFIQNCRLKIGKPKVTKIHGEWTKKTIKCKNRFITPNVTLVHGKKKVVVTNPEHFKPVSDRLPSILCHSLIERNYNIYTQQYHNELSFSAFPLFKETVGPKWDELVAQIDKVWTDVTSNADKIMSEFMDANLSGERDILREKLVKVFSSTKKLIDASPEAILEIFKLGAVEIEALRSFASRNKSDIHIADVEDILTAQELAKISSVHES